jgi:hypothetical protein
MNFLRVHTGLILLAACAAAQPSSAPYTSAEGLQFLRTNCGNCHGGKARASGFDITRLAQPASFREQPEKWSKAAFRVHNGEMPPGSALAVEKREAFVGWVRESLRQTACSNGLMMPAPNVATSVTRARPIISAAAVEAVADRLAGGGGDRCAAREACERRFGGDPASV